MKDRSHDKDGIMIALAQLGLTVARVGRAWLDGYLKFSILWDF